MTTCTAPVLPFPRCQRRQVQAECTGGDLTSDGGVILLRQVDNRWGLLAAVDRVRPAPRAPHAIQHSPLSLLRQRGDGLWLGSEDLNEHPTLRTAVALPTALEQAAGRASAAPLGRLAQRAERQRRWRLHAVRVEPVIAAFPTPPPEGSLDFDATDDPGPGRPAGRVFPGDDDPSGLLPWSGCGGDPLRVSSRRPRHLAGAQPAWALLALLGKRFRRGWPQGQIPGRADRGFCRWRRLSWGDRHGVESLIGVATHARLPGVAEPELAPAAPAGAATAPAPRDLAETASGAQRWERARRVRLKAEHPAHGPNPR